MMNNLSISGRFDTLLKKGLSGMLGDSIKLQILAIREERDNEKWVSTQG